MYTHTHVYIIYIMYKMGLMYIYTWVCVITNIKRSLRIVYVIGTYLLILSSW